ncbi:MAG: serine hydrolase [Vicingaceae bacterium]|nr:serine hydrolase [Vicingaceae bacterium]
MKFLKRFLLTLIIIITIASLLAIISGHAHLFKAISTTYLQGRTGPSIDDFQYFENREVLSSHYQPWELSEKYNHYSNEKLHEEIEKNHPAAFVIVKNNKLIHEEYWDEYDADSQTNSFSMAKSYIGLLIGIAIQEGKISSINDPVGNYLPQYKDSPELTIKNLLTMSSGIDFDESYNSPFGHMSKAYYGTDLKELNKDYKVTSTPGKEWTYLGGNTIILGFILEKVTGQSISEYFSDKIWKKIGAKNNALWTLDKEGGTEKAYCCFYSNARDYAKIGQLLLNHGLWNNERIISENYLNEATCPAYYLKSNGKPVDFYGYQIWTAYYKDLDIYFFRGILGQYTIMIPEKNIVIVRLGHERSTEFINGNPSDFYTYIDFALGI